jgi:hypothetical protein
MLLLLLCAALALVVHWALLLRCCVQLSLSLARGGGGEY